MSAAKTKAWTDTEKVDIYFQIINKLGGTIPWNDLDLPEGRTVKAVQVMFDREKTKLRKAKEAEANGEDGAVTPKTPASGKKRSAKAVDDEDGGAKKKPKTPRKKKSPAKEDSDDEEVGGDAGLVKYESENDEYV